MNHKQDSMAAAAKISEDLAVFPGHDQADEDADLPEEFVEADVEDDGFDESDPFEEAELKLESERGSHLMGAFAVKSEDDKEGIEVALEDASGRPLDGPKMVVAKSNNDDFVELMSKASREYGDKKKGMLDHLTLKWILPTVYAKSILKRIVAFRLGPPGESISVIKAVPVYKKMRTGKKIVRVVEDLVFKVDPEGWLVDNLENRKKLLQAFPDIQEQAWQKSDDHKLFPTGEEVTRGN